MANTIIRIGTRESPLAVWQATQVQNLLTSQNIQAELVYIKSEGDTDLITPLYALGVQGIFTKALDAALLNNRIDIAVHSMKDVPVQMAEGIVQAAVLKRASYKDVFVYKDKTDLEKIGYINNAWSNYSPLTIHNAQLTIATSSVRRIAQWLNRYPNTVIENLRGNVNTRLNKVQTNNWNGAIFAAAGIERINLRPENSVDIDWMLPAPAQGAIVVVCRKDDEAIFNACNNFNDKATALCVKIERDFLKTLMGGCSTPISALTKVEDNTVIFNGNILSTDGKQKVEVNKRVALNEAAALGTLAGEEVLQNGGDKIIEQIRNAGK
ncbi:hydroxymethylbilane synthase [Parafilimonas terrae]|uniref:Hydroxymethylbilane synthase n=1 Tax=Parafilimonas terrae TaxID=1465490 RepID=A0A1I5USP2_9BACT|nr:hydroxymethylbilane synthase [Parafilimonas terrae]SFP98212.1 hydroxymethylbilane synthase [Parafilimonas terrae]